MKKFKKPPEPPQTPPPSPAPSRPDPEAFRQKLRQADKFINEGKFDEAMTELTEAKRIDPGNPFITAFLERISHFKEKSASSIELPEQGPPPPPGLPPPGLPPPGSPTGSAAGADVATAGADRATARTPARGESPDLVLLRRQVEEEYKGRFTEELRKAEETTKALIVEERSKIEREHLKSRLGLERDLETAKKDLEDSYKSRLAEELGLAERRLAGEHSAEMARLEGDIRTQMHEAHQAEIARLKEKLRDEVRSLIEKERAAQAEMDAGRKQDFESRLRDEVAKREAKLKEEYEEHKLREEEKIKIVLTQEFEERLAFERKKTREETDLQKRRGEESIKTEMGNLKATLAEREKELRQEFERKLAEAVEKQRKAGEAETRTASERAREELQRTLSAELAQKLEKEQSALTQEFEKKRKDLETSAAGEIAKAKADGEARAAAQVATAVKKVQEEHAKLLESERNGLESKYQRTLEEKLKEERAKIRQDADALIAAETEKIKAKYEGRIAQLNEQLKTIKSTLQAEMEAQMVQRLEKLAGDYDEKLELLGVRLPETHAERINLYRDSMMSRYAKGMLSIDDAKKLLRLKELLDLSFDDHSMIETEVRLATYSKKIRDMIISGEVKTADPDWLKKLKEQYMITDEEARDLEHHLLMSFQKLPMKGRILIADDDPLILKSISALLTENGYHVVEADNVTDALARLQAQPIDLILSDIKFSADDFEGFTFFKNVQTLPRHAGTPFIFMSALTDDVIIRSGVQLGVDDYLTKPIDPDILTATIEGKIKRHRALKFQ